MKEQILALKSLNPTWGSRKIATALGCSRDYARYYLNPRIRERNTTYRRKKARNSKSCLVDILGGKCVICGYDKCLAALDFHHKDSAEKDIGISQARHWPIEKAKQELTKCVLLCCRCHREFHAGLLELPS